VLNELHSLIKVRTYLVQLSCFLARDFLTSFGLVLVAYQRFCFFVFLSWLMVWLRIFRFCSMRICVFQVSPPLSLWSLAWVFKGQWGSSKSHELNIFHPLMSKNRSQPSIEVKDQPFQCLRADKKSTPIVFVILWYTLLVGVWVLARYNNAFRVAKESLFCLARSTKDRVQRGMFFILGRGEMREVSGLEGGSRTRLFQGFFEGRRLTVIGWQVV